ncbi:MAG TPA: hypothetical protein VIL74_13515 [Pyrinomonadaceae bacterium]|jgi:hypothetical protein
MPLQIPKIDDRRYQDLLDEALNRIPVHNPEWTNFNRSDPGVTLIELFAFMTESLLYRANLIPERNRKKFLQLLGIPLNPATSARGLVTFSNERGPQKTVTLDAGLEVAAGEVPFRTERALDVLPIEGRVYFKRPVSDAAPATEEYYRQLYASFEGATLADEVELKLYETALLDGGDERGVSLGDDTIDNSIWIALLARENEDPRLAREEIANKTLSLGVVPALDAAAAAMPAGGQQANNEISSWLSYEIPKLPPGNRLPNDGELRKPEYKALAANPTTDILTAPGIVEIALPPKEGLEFWENLEPLELGADDFPPTLEDTKLAARLITWLRVGGSATAIKSRLMWIGINAATVSQRARAANEILGEGSGEIDQVFKISRSPVVPGSVRLFVSSGDATEEWSEIDDLLAAGSEVAKPDLREPPGGRKTKTKPAKVFTVDHEAGAIRFGDGVHGQRPPRAARLSVSYDYGAGLAGNVGVGAIDAGAALPAGLKVSNPVRTWGGADSENVLDGERQIKSYLRHQERLVTAGDFKIVTLRTPGVLIGRVEVIPAFHPDFSPNEPGDAPGAVTILVIPKYDAKQPAAPVPDRLFLDTICRHLDERRLITTEVFLRGAVYKPVWISVGINVVAEKSVPEVREAVKRALLDFLAPLDPDFDLLAEDSGGRSNGWRLRKPVAAKELLAVASRVAGVMFVNDVFLAEGDAAASEQIAMNGLELPRVMGISVAVGDALPLAQLRGAAREATGVSRPRRIVPVPVIPENC